MTPLPITSRRRDAIGVKKNVRIAFGLAGLIVITTLKVRASGGTARHPAVAYASDPFLGPRGFAVSLDFSSN
jgi:hypothetical protein